jgi:hypothetical protein
MGLWLLAKAAVVARGLCSLLGSKILMVSQIVDVLETRRAWRQVRRI